MRVRNSFSAADEDPTKNIRGTNQTGIFNGAMVALSFSSLTTAALLDGIRCETRRGWLGCKGRERGSYLISREAAALSPLFFSLSVHRAPAAPGPIDDRAHNVAPPPRILLGQRRRRCSHITISNFHSFLPT